jgi:hypothetical protein
MIRTKKSHLRFYYSYTVMIKEAKEDCGPPLTWVLNEISFLYKAYSFNSLIIIEWFLFHYIFFPT